MNDVPWHEDALFWATIGPVLFNDERTEMASDEVDAILTLTGVRPPASVLDLACGVGRHAIEFARCGFRVTGVDRTAGYIEQARRRSSEENLDVEFVQADMRDFVRDGEFGLVVCLYTSMGYFDDRADDRLTVQNVYRSLEPGGVFLVDVMGREILRRVFHPRNWREEGGCILLEDGKVSENWDRVDNRWIILEGESRSEVQFSMYVYSADELRALLASCGLEVNGIHGWFDGSPYDDKARRLVVASSKPKGSVPPAP